MNDSVLNFATSENLLVDPYVVEFSTFNACRMLSKDRKLNGCQIDPVYIREALMGGGEVLARQVFNDESDMRESADVDNAARTYLETTYSSKAREIRMFWVALRDASGRANVSDRYASFSVQGT